MPNKKMVFCRARTALPFLVLIVAALLLIPTTASAWSGQVVHVTDGDTITAIKDGQRVRIDLYGIDTPESDQPFGSRAERFTVETIGNNRVEVMHKDKDRYGRTVGLVYIEGDGECLNGELVRAGFAWVYDRYCRIRDCNTWKDLESQARKSEIGLWQQACPIPPWKWRHSK